MTPLALTAIVAANVAVNAGLLWLACRLVAVHGPGGDSVTAVRAGGLTLLIFVIGWPLLAAVVGLVVWPTGWPPMTVARYALPPLGVVVPLAVLRWGLTASWWRILGTWVVWRVTSFGQVAVLWYFVRNHVMAMLGD